MTSTYQDCSAYLAAQDTEELKKVEQEIEQEIVAFNSYPWDRDVSHLVHNSANAITLDFIRSILKYRQHIALSK